MSGITISARLDRVDSSTPWGFRMLGGKDFSSPLSVARVTPGSLAEKCGLQTGDVIVRIGAQPTQVLKHKEAQDMIIRSGNFIEFVLQRGGVSGLKAPLAPNPTYQSQFQSPSENFNTAAKPFGSAGDDSLASQTSSMSINNRNGTGSPSESARYQEVGPGNVPKYEGYTDPNLQSRSFTALKTVVDSGRDPADFSKNAPWQLYAKNERGQIEEDTKKYTPSETWKLVHETENNAIPHDLPDSGAPTTMHSRSFKMLEQQMNPGTQQSAPAPGYSAPASKPFVPKHVAQAPWNPTKPTGPRRPNVMKRGAAQFKESVATGMKIPMCNTCGSPIRGPFVVALGKSWCPDHFICANPQCGTKLIDIGFVEENGQLYCEKDYAQFFAPTCAKCNQPIVGDTVNALDKQWHTHCFVCVQCKDPISSGNFHLEDGQPYCEKDWAAMFQTMCAGCDFPVEPGDRWVEALGRNWHSECFNCSTCQINLEGKPFAPKNGRPYCQKHAR